MLRWGPVVRVDTAPDQPGRQWDVPVCGREPGRCGGGQLYPECGGASTTETATRRGGGAVPVRVPDRHRGGGRDSQHPHHRHHHPARRQVPWPEEAAAAELRGGEGGPVPELGQREWPQQRSGKPSPGLSIANALNCTNNTKNRHIAFKYGWWLSF